MFKKTITKIKEPKEVPEIVEQAIKMGGKGSLDIKGVVNAEAAAKAREAGLEVVMDRCICKEGEK